MSNASGLTRSRSDLHEHANNTAFSGLGPPLGSTMSSYANNSIGAPLTSAVSRQFFDDAQAVPLTWNRMVEDMRRSVERYRQAINNGDRSEFVKRAEDISDHLRLLLAAGSGTTDNHSGNPSIISTNKALYPHFRETMSRFSKLVLSSHIFTSFSPIPPTTVTAHTPLWWWPLLSLSGCRLPTSSPRRCPVASRPFSSHVLGILKS